MNVSASIALLLLVCMLGAAPRGWAAEVVDSERGRLLYENHCVVCHTSKVHRRVPQLPLNARELRGIVSIWASGEKLNWTEQDISDVVAYLERHFYPALPR